MGNLDIYEKVRAVPPQACKQIGGGRLKGMTDINPMWRVKTLTERFGPCGFGWKEEIVKYWTEQSMVTDEISAHMIINLYVKLDNDWSAPIVGVGGSMLVSKEKDGYYTNDECYKMAHTDAISVACKALGFGANIYWQNDNTKYNDAKRQAAIPVGQQPAQPVTQQMPSSTPAIPAAVNRQGADFLMNLCVDTGTDTEQLKAYYKVNDFINLSMEQYDQACGILQARRNKMQKGA